MAVPALAACGGDDGDADGGHDAGRDGGSPPDGDSSLLDSATNDGSSMGPTCTPPTRESVTGTLTGRSALTFTQMARATVFPGHIRVQADDLTITLRQWVVTVPNVVGTHRCGDTDSIQVALLGVDGVVGDGGSATASASEGECTIVVQTAAAARGESVAGCFTARIAAHTGSETTEFEVSDGAFLARRQ